MAAVTAQEQLMLELINRARLNPLAEAARQGIDLNQGLAPGTISTAPKQVLAMNDLLVTAARGHSTWMLNTDTFSHTGANGSSAGDRMTQAFYAFTGNWTWGENISWRGTTGTMNASTAIVQHHNGLFLSAGHRTNILGDSFREIGVAQELGVFTSQGTNWNASMVTQNFATSGSAVFVTGVIYNDTTNNDFYDIGEGVGGVAINAGTGADTSSAAGGYEIASSAGTRTVTLGGVSLSLTLTNQNVKLDLVNGNEVFTSTSVTLLGGAVSATLLGIGNATLIGSGAAERLTGNAGNNTLDGGAGADSLFGEGGNDILVFDAADLTAGAVQGGSGIDTAINADATTAISFDMGGRSIEAYFGSEAAEVISAGSMTTGAYVELRGGNDLFWGSNHGDFVLGEAGVDVLYGNGGNDILVGGAAGDWFQGGAGGDTFRFVATSDSALATGSDYITDFSSAEGDKLDFAAITQGQATFNGGWGGTASVYAFNQGGYALVQVYAGTALTMQLLVNQAQLSAGDFVL
jgi:Ca2+-binding RTX toxin-like protein